MGTGKLCECGCGQETRGYDPDTGEPNRFIKNHYTRTEECSRVRKQTRRKKLEKYGRCDATTAKGNRCKHPVDRRFPNSGYCAHHRRSKPPRHPEVWVAAGIA